MNKKIKYTEVRASEALFMFGAWLTTREEVVTFSRNHDSSRMAQLIQIFMDENNLEDPSEAYPDNMIMPEREEIRKAYEN